MSNRTHDHELSISQNKMELAYDGVSGANNSTWFGATFTTTASFVPKVIRLRLAKTGTPGVATVSIRSVDGSSLPTGSDLCSATFDGDALPPTSAPAWKYIYLSSTTLQANTTYAIIIHGTNASSNLVAWAKLSTAGSGVERAVTSTDSGSTWSVLSATTQFLFEIFDVVDLNLIRDESKRAMYSVSE